MVIGNVNVKTSEYQTKTPKKNKNAKKEHLLTMDSIFKVSFGPNKILFLQSK